MSKLQFWYVAVQLWKDHIMFLEVNFMAEKSVIIIIFRYVSAGL